MSKNPKFKDLNEAFWYIRENPLEYLPEKSLVLFDAFWLGYKWRYEFEHKEYKGFELLDGFNEFMCKKIRVPSRQNSLQVAELYSNNQSEAFDLWFSCLEEYLSKKNGTTEIEKYYAMLRETGQPLLVFKEPDFFGLLQMLLKRPQMYFGKISFTLTEKLISGWMRATKDFDFEESEQEKTFKAFQQYIEERPFGFRATQYIDLLPSPNWNKIICFRCFNEEMALELFATFFDEFAFQGKGYIEKVEFHWKNHLEHQKKCQIIREWESSNFQI